MTVRFKLCCFLLSAATLVPSHLNASVVVLNFEGFVDGTALTTQYPGFTFSNAIILSSGISLNEFEFPPHSGVNVVSDDGGPMTITLGTPATSFGGYFTYAEPLTIDAFGTAFNLVASVTSPFSNNEAMSGDLGSSPNEFLQVSYGSGISEIRIIGDPLGGSFTLDDATIKTGASTVPEPRFSSLFCAAGLFLFLAHSLRKCVRRWRFL
jgi:hypothetical protein